CRFSDSASNTSSIDRNIFLGGRTAHTSKKRRMSASEVKRNRGALMSVNSRNGISDPNGCSAGASENSAFGRVLRILLELALSEFLHPAFPNTSEPHLSRAAGWR